jgi:hypothetical protein
MAIKTVKNPKGSGGDKSEGRLRLEGIDLIKLMDNHDTKYITNRYGVSRQIYYQVLTEQFSDRNIGFKRVEVDESSIKKYKGAWMGSDMRKFMFENELLESQNKIKSEVR